jgi:hypothetical protein
MWFSPRSLGVFALSFVMGTLYAGLVGLISSSLSGPLISWLVWVGLFWLAFGKFNCLRFAGFIAILPASLLGFEVMRSLRNPGMNADIYRSFDRSHYTPGLRVKNPKAADHDDAPKEILIGRDGFRADPGAGQGNPERCRYVMIGDSMIYGSGLAYPYTFGPVLTELGLPTCVFGVTGNSPVDYLSTLRYVADRIEPGAHVAFYIYAYNDFVGLNRYVGRGLLATSNTFHKLFEWAFYLDSWRRTAWLYSLVHPQSKRPPMRLYQYTIGNGQTVRIIYNRDPADYAPPEPLTQQQRTAFGFFLDGLEEIAKGRSWRVFLVIHPDDAEIYANFARRSPAFEDLDPRRAESLKICKDHSFRCEDISRYVYQRAFAAGKNPYFENDRHFSAFGTRIVAEHFAALTKPAS